jgi:CRP/FNR family transcriptional regulator, cyclic AMP receptor protein
MSSPQQQQQQQFDKPSGIASQPQNLESLLNELRSSNISNLNSVHGRGVVLFAEGEPVRGAYILRSGRATVSISSNEGHITILRIAEAGDVLGLNSVLQNGSYDTTVRALEPCRTDFIPRAQLLDLMEQREAGARVILEIVSRELAGLIEHAKLVFLPVTVSARLARLLLEWGKENGSGTLQLDKILTHEQIAQMICSSRETVTRLLASLVRQQVISVSSDIIVINDRSGLEKLAFG